MRFNHQLMMPGCPLCKAAQHLIEKLGIIGEGGKRLQRAVMLQLQQNQMIGNARGLYLQGCQPAADKAQGHPEQFAQILPELILNPMRAVMLKLWIGLIEKQHEEMIQCLLNYMVSHLTPVGGGCGFIK